MTRSWVDEVVIKLHAPHMNNDAVMGNEVVLRAEIVGPGLILIGENGAYDGAYPRQN